MCLLGPKRGQRMVATAQNKGGARDLARESEAGAAAMVQMLRALAQQTDASHVARRTWR